MDELEFSEAESNVLDLISEYQQYQQQEHDVYSESSSRQDLWDVDHAGARYAQSESDHGITRGKTSYHDKNDDKNDRWSSALSANRQQSNHSRQGHKA